MLRMSIPQPPAVGDGTIVMGNADGLLIILSMESGSSSITPGRMKRRSRCSSRHISSGLSLILVVFFFFFFSSLVDLMLVRLSLSESELMRNGIDIADNSRRSCIFGTVNLGLDQGVVELRVGDIRISINVSRIDIQNRVRRIRFYEMRCLNLMQLISSLMQPNQNATFDLFQFITL